MASNNIKKKQILNQFQDNEVGNITAGNLRNFINSIFDDKEVIVKKFATLDAFEASPIEDRQYIYEDSLVVISNSTDLETGIYISLTNQPQSRSQLSQIANAVISEDVNNLTKTSTEYIAFNGQYFFEVEYKDNFIDVFINGKKLRESELILDNNGVGQGNIITLKIPLSTNDYVDIVSFN
jgi:hypothetical protein